jgi:peptidoglycan/LPS O-acetylase OafA/YrhL
LFLNAAIGRLCEDWSPCPVSDSRLTGLDLLRALACVLVFLHHTTQRLNFDALSPGWQDYYLFFNMGAFGVAIFFLLSGFLLAHPYWMAFDAGAPMPSLLVYAVRRAARIMPGYYAALTVTFILAATVFAVPITGDIIRRYAAGLFFVNEFHWLTLFPVEINGPLWSIGMEVASYALLPVGLLALFALRSKLAGWRGRLVFVAVVAAALSAQYLVITLVPKETFQADFKFGMVGGAKYWMPQYNVAGFFAVFALGSLAAGASTLWKRPRSGFADVLVLAGLAVAAWQMWSSGPNRYKPEAFGWLSIPFDFPAFHLGIALALICFPHVRWLSGVSELLPIRYAATISFGVYIWHFLILELIRQYFEPKFFWNGIASPTRWLELTTLAFTLAVLAGSLSWFAIERPALHWGRRLEEKLAIRLPSRASPHKLHA